LSVKTKRRGCKKRSGQGVFSERHIHSQRIDLRCHIPPLDRSQTAEYISAHIAYAAGSHIEIFTDAAISAIFDYSAGLPRKINRVASICLMHAAQVNKRLVDDHMVSLLIDGELSW